MLRFWIRFLFIIFFLYILEFSHCDGLLCFSMSWNVCTCGIKPCLPPAYIVITVCPFEAGARKPQPGLSLWPNGVVCYLCILIGCMLKCYLHTPDDHTTFMRSLKRNSVNMISNIVHPLTVMAPNNDSVLHQLHARRTKSNIFPMAQKEG
jgi:hypothetical protein